jgi:hypothetical protein
MDVIIEARGLGFVAAGHRWWIHLDGLKGVHDLEKTVWTIQHRNGAVVNIPKAMLSKEALGFLRDWSRHSVEYRADIGSQLNQKEHDPQSDHASFPPAHLPGSCNQRG